MWLQIWNQLWFEPACEKGTFGFFKSAKPKVSRMRFHRFFEVSNFDGIRYKISVWINEVYKTWIHEFFNPYFQMSTRPILAIFDRK